jgi:hypothetical protein
MSETSVHATQATIGMRSMLLDILCFPSGGNDGDVGDVAMEVVDPRRGTIVRVRRYRVVRSAEVFTTQLTSAVISRPSLLPKGLHCGKVQLVVPALLLGSRLPLS